MENLKHLGVLFGGIAALLTAFVPIFSYLKQVHQQNFERIESVQKEQTKQNYMKDLRKFALVNDPDGWVNLRSAPNASSSVIMKIENGYKVEILDKQGNWFKVRTSLEEVGFVYFDRLKSL